MPASFGRAIYLSSLQLVLMLWALLPGSAWAQIPTSEPDAAEELDEQSEEAVDSSYESTVRASAADALESASGSGTTITKDQLRKAAPEQGAEVLRRVPGVNVPLEDTAGLRLNIGLRGFNPERSRLVYVEEDGVPIAVSPYGEPELYWSTPLERLASIDVIKGSDVLRSGPPTVGGVIRLHTLEPTRDRSWSVEGTAGQQAFGRALVRYSDSEGDASYLIQAMHKRSDGFRGMGFDATDVWGKVNFSTGDRSEATLKLAFYDETSKTTYVGLTDPLYQADPRQNTVAPDDRLGIRRYEFSLRHTVHWNASTSLTVTAFATQTQLAIRQQEFDRSRVEGVDYTRVVGPSAIDGAALYFRNSDTIRDRTYQLLGVAPELERRFTTGSVDHKLLVGGRVLIDNARRRLSQGDSPTDWAGDLLSDDTTTILGLSGYVQDRIALTERVQVSPILRIEQLNSKRTTRRESVEGGVVDENLGGHSHATGILPGISASVGSPHANLFGSIHSGFSPPRIAQAITPDGRDAGLKAERSINSELGGRVRPVRYLRAELTGFLIKFDNELISNNTVLSNSSAELKNGGATRHAGFETAAQIEIGQGLQLPFDLNLAAQYTFADARFADGPNRSNFVPYAPQHHFAATLDFEHRSGLAAQATLTYVGKQFADELNVSSADISGRLGAIPGYKIVDLGASYHHARTNLTLSATLKNALDQIYLSTRLPNGIFTAGFRQAFVTLRWSK